MSYFYVEVMNKGTFPVAYVNLTHEELYHAMQNHARDFKKFGNKHTVIYGSMDNLKDLDIEFADIVKLHSKDYQDKPIIKDVEGGE